MIKKIKEMMTRRQERQTQIRQELDTIADKQARQILEKAANREIIRRNIDVFMRTNDIEEAREALETIKVVAARTATI